MGVKKVYPGVFEFDTEYEFDDSAAIARLARWSRLQLETRFTKRLSNFEELPGNKEALEAVVTLIRGEVDPPLLFLYGKPGTGKSHLGQATAWCYIAQGKSVLYYHAGDLARDLMDGIKIDRNLQPGEFDSASTGAIINYLKKIGMLVIDDLGLEVDSKFVDDSIDTIVDYRFRQKSPTLIMANTLDIPDRVLDRAKEGMMVRLVGPSYRERIQRRKKGDKAQ
jgi:DNA replication protein DnaC